MPLVINVLYDLLVNYSRILVITDPMLGSKEVQVHELLKMSDFSSRIEWNKYLELCDVVYSLVLQCSQCKRDSPAYYASRQQCVEQIDGLVRFLAHAAEFNFYATDFDLNTINAKKYHVNYLVGMLYKYRISSLPSGIAPSTKNSQTMRKYIEFVAHCILVHDDRIIRQTLKTL